MREEFTVDVILSHSSMDKAVVRPLVERLRQDRLEHSRVPVLCMSVNVFESEWVRLEDRLTP